MKLTHYLVLASSLLYPSVSFADTLLSWKPVSPSFDQEFDWLKTTSGEWLKGDLITLYKEELEFDSKEFGIQVINISDVTELYTKGEQSIRLNDGTLLSGKLIIKDNKFSVAHNGFKQSYALSNLLSIASAEGIELGYWNAEVNFGTNFRRGNSEQSDYTISAEAQRRTASSRFRSYFISNFSQRKSLETGKKQDTTNDQRLTGSYDWFFSPKTFIRLADYEYFADEFGNIDNRHTFGIGIGYKLIDIRTFSWEVSAGPSYQTTDYISVESGQNDKETSAVINLGMTTQWTISKNIDFDVDYQIKVVSEDAGHYIHRFKTGIEIDLIGDFDLDLTFYLDRIEEPKKAGLVIPNKNDYRFVVSLSYKF
ncbi:YdiY family protein [Pseudoalteromonas sp.]|uniref:DUF481 domain-containing protein n=1 Tax=Pseudoalteromonas sp. TaxID=53249 RepID=UPI00356209B0